MSPKQGSSAEGQARTCLGQVPRLLRLELKGTLFYTIWSIDIDVDVDIDVDFYTTPMVYRYTCGSKCLQFKGLDPLI